MKSTAPGLDLGAGPGLGLARGIMLGAPLLWAILAPFHPDPEDDGIYLGLSDEVGRWLFVHVAQMVLAPFLAITVLMLLRGISSLAATISRVALVIWLVFFSAYDAMAGIGTGVLVQQANDATGAERAGLAAAADAYWDSHLSGNRSWFGGVATVAWPIVAIAAAVAVRRAGADWPTTAATVVAALFAFHAGWPAAIGLVALLVACLLAERARPQWTVTTPRPVAPSAGAGV